MVTQRTKVKAKVSEMTTAVCLSSAVPVPEVDTKTARLLSGQPMQCIGADPVLAVSAAEAMPVVVPTALETDAPVDPSLNERPSSAIDDFTVDAIRMSGAFRLYLID